MDARKAALVAIIMVAGHFFLTLVSAAVNFAFMARQPHAHISFQWMLSFGLHLGAMALLDGGVIIFLCFFRSVGNQTTEQDGTNFEV